MIQPPSFPERMLHVHPRLGEMVPVGAIESPLPLESTSVLGQVIGPIVTVAVTQRFRNPLHEPAELAYLLPLPENAAIVDFELCVGSRVIRADLQEIEQARQKYDEARQQGQQAGLLEQRRPNLFAIQIANVLPGQSLQATLRYQEKVRYNDGEFEFIFPMGITPKYHSPAHPPGHPQESAGVDAPIALDRELIGPIDISVSVDAGVPAADPTSPSHPLEVTRLDDRRFTVRLSGRHIPDHDFVLRYAVNRQQVALAAWRSAGTTSDYFLATLLPPVLEEIGQRNAWEFIFVLDRSGSMTGEPIAQAVNALRACLRALDPGDQFRILLFDDQLEWYQQEASPVTQNEIEKADRFLSTVQGRGGTEIVSALQAALGLPATKERSRLVVFLTDGAVSAEERALEMVRRQLGNARLFTFGIGPSVNRALLQRLARLGRGASEFLGLNEDIEGAILRFQDRVSFPALTDIHLSWENGTAWDVYPSQLSDLYVGQPLEISGLIKSSEAANPILVVTGRQGNQAVEMRLPLPAATSSEPAITRLWARARLDDLLEQQSLGSLAAHTARAEVISLALEHRLVTPYTAFVAIDSEVVNVKGKPQLFEIAQPLPLGLDLAGFLGQPAGSGIAFSAMPASQAMPPASLRRRAFQPVLDTPASPSFSLDLPSFLRRRPSQTKVKDASLSGSPESSPTDEDSFLQEERAVPQAKNVQSLQDQEAEALFRFLARTQNLDGSWNGDILFTAAALLAFVRHGHTTRAGHYRQQVRRAAEWLSGSSPAGFAAFARAVALSELAAATRQSIVNQITAKRTAAGLPVANTSLERAALAYLQGQRQAIQTPMRINDLDDLWLAAINNTRFESIPPEIRSVQQSDLARTLAAAIVPTDQK